MKVYLDNKELSYLFGLVQKTIQILEKKEPKPQTESGVILSTLSEILEKIQYTIVANKNINEGTVDLNRRQTKLIRDQLDLSKKLLLVTYDKYRQLDDNNPPFSDKEGRRKVDYLYGIQDRIDIVNNIEEKILQALV